MTINPNGITSWPDLLKQGGAQAVGATIVGGKPAAVIQGPLPGTVGGLPVAVQARNVLTVPGILPAVVRTASRMVMPLAVANALREEYCEAGGQGFVCDPLGDMAPDMLWCIGTFCARDPVVAATAKAEEDISAWITSSGAVPTGWAYARRGTMVCQSTNFGQQRSCSGREGVLKEPSGGVMAVYSPGYTLSQRQELACPEGQQVVGNKCTTGAMVAATPQHLNERVTRALEKGVPAIVEELKRLGEDLRALSKPQELSGPPKTTGQPSTSQITKPDGQVVTRTVTPTYHHTYNIDNSITTTTVNRIEDSDGTVVEEGEKPDQTPPAVDPDLPPVPDLYEQKYPDGLAGVWNARKAELESSGLVGLVRAMAWDVGAGGCPQWRIPLMTSMGNVQEFDASVPCWVWDFVRVFLMVCAVIAARRIIFGG